MLTAFFTPHYALSLAGRLRELAESLIGGGVARGRFDMVQDVMVPLMSEFTMADMLGLEVTYAALYAAPVHHLTEHDYPRHKAEAELRWLEEQLRDDLREGRVAADTVFNRLQHAQCEAVR